MTDTLLPKPYVMIEEAKTGDRYWLVIGDQRMPLDAIDYAIMFSVAFGKLDIDDVNAELETMPAGSVSTRKLSKDGLSQRVIGLRTKIPQYFPEWFLPDVNYCNLRLLHQSQAATLRSSEGQPKPAVYQPQVFQTHYTSNRRRIMQEVRERYTLCRPRRLMAGFSLHYRGEKVDLSIAQFVCAKLLFKPGYTLEDANREKQELEARYSEATPAPLADVHNALEKLRKKLKKDLPKLSIPRLPRGKGMGSGAVLKGNTKAIPPHIRRRQATLSQRPETA